MFAHMGDDIQSKITSILPLIEVNAWMVELFYFLLFFWLFSYAPPLNGYDMVLCMKDQGKPSWMDGAIK